MHLQLSRRVCGVFSPVSKVKPYLPPDSLKTALQAQNCLKLDYNESTIGPHPELVSDTSRFINLGASQGEMAFSWYPNLGGSLMKTELAAYTQVPQESLLLGNGSDDLLKLICETFLEKGDRVLVPQPSYPQVSIFIQGLQALEVGLEFPDPFENCLTTLVNAIHRESPRIVYLITPNNPTGTEWDLQTIRQLCADFPSTLFIVDEAYVEFSTHKTSMAPELLAYENAVVTRTFSKLWGLAAFRLGFLSAHVGTITQLSRLYNVKSINQLAQVAGLSALKHREFYLNHAEQVCQARDAVVGRLRAKGFEARSRGGNFFVIKVGENPKKVVKEMGNRGVFVRDIDSRFPGYIRVTAGTPEQMKRVEHTLEEALAAISTY